MSAEAQPRFSNEAIKRQWDDLEELELEWIDGRADHLIQALTTKYGLSKDEAGRQVAEFSKSAKP